MKKSLGILAVAIIFTGLTVTSCSTPSEKVDDAKENVEEANEELEEREAYLKEVENFRSQTAIQISENEKSIIAFNERIANQKKEAKEDYKKKITDLEAKNSDMKKKMDDFNADSKAGWEKFKREFNYDMEMLGNAFRDLGENNKN